MLQFAYLFCAFVKSALSIRPNDRNISTQHIVAALLGATYCVRLATLTLLRRVATCWVFLAQVCQFEPTTQHVATGRQNARSMLRSTILRCVVLKFWDRLARAGLQKEI